MIVVPTISGYLKKSGAVWFMAPYGDSTAAFIASFLLSIDLSF